MKIWDYFKEPNLTSAYFTYGESLLLVMQSRLPFFTFYNNKLFFFTKNLIWDWENTDINKRIIFFLPFKRIIINTSDLPIYQLNQNDQVNYKPISQSKAEKLNLIKYDSTLFKELNSINFDMLKLSNQNLTNYHFNKTYIKNINQNNLIYDESDR